MPLDLATLAERPELGQQVSQLHGEAWPRFMLHDTVAEQHWHSLFSTFAELQVVLIDDAGTAIAAGHAIPANWDGTVEGLPEGWDSVFEQGVRIHEQAQTPNVLCALAIVVAPAHQSKGLSSAVLRAMKATAATHRFDTLIAPVRPTLKSRYPLAPMERYVHWRRVDGLPFDPWLRVHVRMGAELLRLAPKSMVITGTVSDWENWTEMAFPETGAYVVPGALQPVLIDREQDRGCYDDPNVWMRHTVRENVEFIPSLGLG